MNEFISFHLTEASLLMLTYLLSFPVIPLKEMKCQIKETK